MAIRLDQLNKPIRLNELGGPIRLDQLDKKPLRFQPGTLLAQSFIQSMADKPAMMLRGTEVFTPGEKTIDPLLRKTSFFLQSLKDPKITKKVEQAAGGKLWPIGEGKKWYQLQPKYLPEVINAWAANIGDQIPIMLATLGGRALGKVLGKPLGALAGTVWAGITGGPDPTDVATAPAVVGIVSKITEHLGGAAPMIAMEAGGFMDAADNLNLDKDIAEKYARIYGPTSGAIEYAQHLWTLGIYKRIPKKARGTIIKKVLKEIGGGVVEGLEEVTQGGLQNYLLKKAVIEQKKRHPEYKGEAPELFEEAERQFAIGAGVSLLTRLPAHAMRATSKSIDKHYAKIDKKEKEKLKSVAGFELNTPTQIETAEGTIGFENDFFIEELEKRPPKFKEPGTAAIVTPKWLVNRMMGVEPLLEDVAAAEETRMVEQQNLSQWIIRIKKQLKKQKQLKGIDKLLKKEKEKEIQLVPTEIETAEGIIGYEPDVSPEILDILKLERKLKGSKNPVHIMRDLLDTYEEAPIWMDKDSARIFNQIRELTRYMRDRANRVREQLGMEPIREVKAYITHWMDSIAQQMIKQGDKFPVQTGYLYKLMKGLPKKITNPTAIKRTLKHDMEQKFSKDLGLLLRTMINYDLRDIHITAPYQAAWDELNELRRNNLIGDETFKEVEKYLSYDIRKFKTPADKAFDASLQKPTDFVNKLLAPLGKHIFSPSKTIFNGFRRLAHLSGLALRPRPMFRNLGQRLLNLDFYRAQDLAKAQFAPIPMVEHPITGEQVNLLELIREQDWYKASLRKFQEVDTAIRGVEAAAMKPYSRTHIGNRFISNVEVSALVGYYDWLHRYQQSQYSNSNHYKHSMRMAKKLDIPGYELLTQKGDMMWNIREAVRRTQWEYMSISMPSFYRGEFKKALGVFQSWWMNYFFNHMRESSNQVFTGRNSQGRAITPYARLRALKGMGTIVAIGKLSKAMFGIQMLKYLFFPAPGYLPPIPEFVIGITQYIAADDDRGRKKALWRVKNSLKIWIPFRAAWRDLNKFLSGEYDIADYIFYREKKK